MKRRDFNGLSILALSCLFLVSPFSSSEHSNTGSFFVTITTYFPRWMNIREYRSLLPQWKDNGESSRLVEDMIKEKKILSKTASYLYDKSITCFEFTERSAWDEYVLRFSKIQNNSAARKKELGFYSKKEFKKTILS